MGQQTIGEVDWESADLPGEGSRESDFLQLEEGDNKGRVLSNPQQFYVHWVVDETGKKRKVNCATTGCPVCMRGQDNDKASARWLIKFFSRKAGKVRLLEISSQAFKGIKSLVQDPEWGPVTDYDINVKRGAPGSQPLYTVIPGRRAPLTVEEKQALSVFNDRLDITRFTTPPTPEVVAEKLGWSLDTSNTKVVTNEFQSSRNGSMQKPTTAPKKASIDFDFDK